MNSLTEKTAEKETRVKDKRSCSLSTPLSQEAEIQKEEMRLPRERLNKCSRLEHMPQVKVTVVINNLKSLIFFKEEKEPFS